MKINKILKYLFVLLVLAFLFKSQYSTNSSVSAIQKEISANNTQPFSPFDDASDAQLPHNSKDLIRLELLVLFLFLLSYAAFSFSIFQFPSIPVWIHGEAILKKFHVYRLKNRAPPLIFLKGV